MFMSAMNYITTTASGDKPVIDNLFFSFSIFSGILNAVFISLFIGTEYSDGTIRNKISVGHMRRDIYLSSFVVCAIAGIVICLLYLSAALAVGIPLMGFFEAAPELVFATALCMLVASVAFSSVFLLIAMLCQNRAVTAVVNILLVFTLLFAAIYIRARLNEPETITQQTIATSDDGITNVTEESLANPNYLEGTKRDVYEFLNDFLPTGQCVQFTNMEAGRLPLLAAYSAGISVGFAGIGMYAFRKKDIK